MQPLLLLVSVFSVTTFLPALCNTAKYAFLVNFFCTKKMYKRKKETNAFKMQAIQPRCHQVTLTKLIYIVCTLILYIQHLPLNFRAQTLSLAIYKMSFQMPCAWTVFICSFSLSTTSLFKGNLTLSPTS